jgi:hypothetical protein
VARSFFGKRRWKHGGDAPHGRHDPGHREGLGRDAVRRELEEAGVAVRLEEAALVRVHERLLEHGYGQDEQYERGNDEPSWEHLGASLTVSEAP